MKKGSFLFIILGIILSINKTSTCNLDINNLSELSNNMIQDYTIYDFEFQPTLSFANQNSIHVRWKSPFLGANSVYYWKCNNDGTLEFFNKNQEDFDLQNYPFIKLNNLEKNSKYFYVVVSKDLYLKTLVSSPREFKIGLWADNQKGKEIFSNYTVPALKREAPDFLMAVGDLVEKGEKEKKWNTQLYGIIGEMLGSIPLLPVRGNHDGESQTARTLLPFPQDQSWYSLKLGSIFFVVLDSNFDIKPESEQYEWLIKVLTSSAWKNAKYRIVAFHHPPYVTKWLKMGLYSGHASIRKHVVPLLSNYKADIVFNGHAHYYQHSIKTNANGHQTHYLTIGGAGGKMNDWAPVNIDWSKDINIIKTAQVHHIAILSVKPYSLEIDIIATTEINSEEWDKVTYNPQKDRYLIDELEL